MDTGRIAECKFKSHQIVEEFKSQANRTSKIDKEFENELKDYELSVSYMTEELEEEVKALQESN